MDERKPSSSRPKRSARTAAGVPALRRVVFRRRLRSPMFTAGCYGMRDSLALVQESAHTFDSDDELTEAIARAIDQQLQQSPARRQGALLALASWIGLILDGTGVADLASWTPFDSQSQTLSDDDGMEQPEPHSALFEVAGAPVSVGQDQTVLAWPSEPGSPPREASLDLVRLVGNAIDKSTFDRLRAGHRI